MRHSIRTPMLQLLAALVVSAGLSGCAGQRWNGPQSLQGTAQSAVPGRGNVFAVQRQDGLVVLSGWVDGDIGHLAVLRDVGQRDDVAGVIDRLRVNRF